MEDYDNYLDVILDASSTRAATAVIQLKAYDTDEGYASVYNPGGPGIAPTPGVPYSTPAPPLVRDLLCSAYVTEVRMAASACALLVHLTPPAAPLACLLTSVTDAKQKGLSCPAHIPSIHAPPGPPHVLCNRADREDHPRDQGPTDRHLV